MTDTYGPIISFVPLTEYPGNLIGLWLDLTPVGFTAQICLGQRTMVVGWLTKRPRPRFGFHSRGWAAFRRARSVDEFSEDE